MSLFSDINNKVYTAAYKIKTFTDEHPTATKTAATLTVTLLGAFVCYKFVHVPAAEKASKSLDTYLNDITTSFIPLKEATQNAYNASLSAQTAANSVTRHCLSNDTELTTHINKLTFSAEEQCVILCDRAKATLDTLNNMSILTEDMCNAIYNGVYFKAVGDILSAAAKPAICYALTAYGSVKATCMAVAHYYDDVHCSGNHDE